MTYNLESLWRQHALDELLAIAPTDDTRAIKKAYASRLKVVRPDDDPIAFQSLRDAYTLALEAAAFLRALPSDERDKLDNAQAAQENTDLRVQYSTQSDIVPGGGPGDRHFAAPWRNLDSEIVQPQPLVASPSANHERSAEVPLRPRVLAIHDSAKDPSLRAWPEMVQAYGELDVPSQASAIAWLYAQPEFDSLVNRAELSVQFQELALTLPLSWHKLAALSEFLDWGDAVSDVHPAVREKLHFSEMADEVQNRPVNQRYLQELRNVPARRGILTRWLVLRLFSSEFPAWMLHQPFSWWLYVLSAFRPMLFQTNQILFQLYNLHIAPEELLNAEQVRAQQQLRHVGFNKFKAAQHLPRIMLLPLFFWAVIYFSPIRKTPFDADDLVVVWVVSGGLAAAWLFVQLHQSHRIIIWHLAQSKKAVQPLLWLGTVAAIAAVIAFVGNPNAQLLANALSVFAVFCVVRHWAAGVLLTLGTVTLARAAMFGSENIFADPSALQRVGVLLSLHFAAALTYVIQLKFPGPERALRSAMTPANPILDANGQPINLGKTFFYLSLVFLIIVAVISLMAYQF